MSRDVRVALAGDRLLAVEVLEVLLAHGTPPVALLVPTRGTHRADLEQRTGLPRERILVGPQFRAPEGIRLLRDLELDYLLSIHFPYVVPPEVLAIPSSGCLNLHPALLPYNRGWHTPSWAILDQTPAGATLHHMTEALDAGDIVGQRPVEVRPDDTADSLYQRLLATELALFEEHWPTLAAGSTPRTPQPSGVGTAHAKADLAAHQVLDLESIRPVGDVLRTLRALTTNRLDEAAYFEVDGARFHVQVTITKAPEEGA